MGDPISHVWAFLKAFPEESLFTEEDRSKPFAINSPGDYGQMPHRRIHQRRHKTLHPAIQGLLNRTQHHYTTGKGKIRGDINALEPDAEIGPHPVDHGIWDEHPRQPFILDVPTLDRDEKNIGTSAYMMMGRADNDPDISAWIREGQGYDADMRRANRKMKDEYYE